MKMDRLNQAVDACQEFINRAKKVPPSSPDNGRAMDGQQVAACKRASMDATRALARLRLDR